MSDITKEELEKEIAKILEKANLKETSTKKVIQQLEKNLGANLTDKKKMIDQLIMDYVNSKESEDEEEEEDDESEVRKRKPIFKQRPSRRSYARAQAFTNEEYADILYIYGFCNGNDSAARAEYIRRYPNRRAPFPTVFSGAYRRVSETGSFQPRRFDVGRSHVCDEDDSSLDSTEEEKKPPTRKAEKKPTRSAPAPAYEEDSEEEVKKPPKKKARKKGSDGDSDEDWGKGQKAEKAPKAKKAGGRGKGGGYTRAYKLSPALAELMGADEMPRHEVVKRVWTIIKEKKLYDPNNKQFAICDDSLYRVIGTKRFRTFGMMKYLKNHFITD